METEESKKRVAKKSLLRIENPRHSLVSTSTLSMDLRNLQRSFFAINLRGLDNLTRIPQLVYQQNNQLGEKEESTSTSSPLRSPTWSEVNHKLV